MVHSPGSYYEIFVQSFCDSNGDGIGDLNGVTSKLDYLKNLGVEGIWLMPIHPSPSYHKYDVADYYSIHADYGSMADFKNLVNEAHNRKIRVIIDLVINHVSAQHPWFQDAIKGPTSPYRDYFIWMSEEDIQLSGRAVKEEETEDSDNLQWWNEVPGQSEKYFAYFWSGMPDLNYDNPKVREAIFRIGQYWLEETGIDGFRLDAAKHIFPDDRAEENHQFWVEFRQEMQVVKPNVFLVGEVWDKMEVVGPFLKGLNSVFNFDLGNAIVNAVLSGEGGHLVKDYIKIHQYYKSISDDFVDGTFIRNHDQDRILSVVKDRKQKAKLAASLLLTLPGTPFIYYGEELGMRGKKPDENIREPFPWGPDDPGVTSWKKIEYNTEFKVPNLQSQLKTSRSFYHHYRRLLHYRKSKPALYSGDIEPIEINHQGICAFKRIHKEGALDIFHNLTNTSITVESEKLIDLSIGGAKMDVRVLKLPPYSTAILK